MSSRAGPSVAAVGMYEAKVQGALLAADVLALLEDPARTRQRMASRRTPEEFAAVALVADAVRELVRREVADRRSRGQPPVDGLMLARRALSALVDRAFVAGHMDR